VSGILVKAIGNIDVPAPHPDILVPSAPVFKLEHLLIRCELLMFIFIILKAYFRV
jgi:hypothetical protein